jgi:hypothetical protein
MSKVLRRTAKHLLMVVLCVSCCAVTGCIESSFQLAGSSRLPQWITIPSGLTRKDVSVTMNYYSNPFGPDVKFLEKDKNGRILSKVSGKTRGCPLQGKNPPPGVEPGRGYPGYVVITVDGITEIIEHKKMEPLFYVNDDPIVRNESFAELAKPQHCY